MIPSPSTTVAGGVHGEAAVGVAVVGDAEVGAVVARPPAASGAEGASSRTPSLMLRPSGSSPTATVTRARRPRRRSRRDAREPRRSRSRRRRAGRRGAGPPGDAEQVHEVAVLGVGELAACGRRRRPWAWRSGSAMAASMRSSTSSGSFSAAVGEELDAVVGRRVVRRRDHHAEVGVDVLDEERRRRGRDDTGVEHVDAGAREPAATAAEMNSPRCAGRARRTARGRRPSARRLAAWRPWVSTVAAAWASPRAKSPVITSPLARPRTPSVPNSRAMARSPLSASRTARPCGPS